MLFHSTSGIPVNKHLTMKMHTQNMAENWSSLTKLDKDISMDGAVIKMENEMTDSINIPESQDNSRSCSPADGQSSRDGAGNKVMRADSKICGVCGDKALGNNFNAITCESCKAFFRRNALKPKEFVCPFSNSCKVDPVTRRFCQKCRLKKCFDIGMKKEWIMSPEEKKIKKIKIEQNRKKRQSSDAIPLSCEPPVSKAACMIDPNKYQYQFSQIESHDHLVLVPQNSPPDPTLPHKVAKQAMMPHEEQSPSPSSSSFSFQQHQQQQLSPIPMPMTTLPSPSSSFSSTSNHSNSCNNNPSPNLASSLSGNLDDSKNSSMSSSLISFTNVNDTTLINMGQQQQQHHSLGIKSKSNLNTDQIFVEQNMHCESNRNQILNSSNSCSSGPGSSSSSSLPLSLWSDSNIENSSLKILHGTGQEHENGVGDCVVVKDESHLILRGENIANSNRNGDQSTCQQPLPLLSSLIRPAIPESPPETQFISDYDHHMGRHLNSVTVIEPEMDQQHNQEEQQSSPSSFLTGNRNCSYGDTNGLHSASGDTGMESTGTSAGNNSKQNFSSDSSDDDRSGHSGGGNSNGRAGAGDVGGISFALNIADMICAGSQSNEAHKISGGGGYHENEQDIMPLPLNTMDSILSVAITAEYNAFSALNGSGLGSGGRGGGGSGSNSRLLNRAEQNKLNELLLASQALNDPVDAEGPVKVSDPSLINVINLTDIAIRRLIKMSKKISGFKNMCQEDQVALLKGSCTEMMILRSVVSYDPDRDSWNIPHSDVGYNIKLGVLKEARGNLYEEHQRFVKSFDGKWRLNENIMMILCAITLFTPERANVIHKDVVKLEQASYYYLLKRYLESFLDGCTARSTYIKLIDRIAQLHRLNNNHLRVFLEVNPREVEPLLIEIFDLK